MEQSSFDLEAYLSNGVENIVTTVLKSTWKNPKESKFFLQYAAASKRARKLRQKAEENNIHIPPFLIASITNQCNLHCKGCYARANHSCSSHAARKGLMDEREWRKVFTEARDVGIGFILLAGGEPLLRKDVLGVAAEYKEILFPIFTNGTMLNEEYVEVFYKNRNLVPVLSIEGSKETTDARRGEGIYQKLSDTMQVLHKREILFAASITVTKENEIEVLSEGFINELVSEGCKAVIYVEYVPVDHVTRNLALEDADRESMARKIEGLRERFSDMLFVSFPGDEKTSGGCLAAGRGFFHINAHGGAEPCPFSPYSDTNLKTTSLIEALNSPLFVSLRKQGSLTKEHIGGCVLFEQEEEVKKMLGDAK